MIAQKFSNLAADEERRLRFAYLALSLISGFVELGIIVYFITNRFSITQILVVGLCYQLGNLAVSSLKISKRTIVMFLILGLAVIGARVFLMYGWTYYYLVIVLSLALQKARRMIQEKIRGKKVTTFSKRLVRIIGFLLAGLATNAILMDIISLLLILVLLVVSSAIPDHWYEINTIGDFRSSPLAWIMVIHQTHYFSYALWVPMVLVRSLDVPHHLIGFFFILGWLSYINTEKLFGKLNNKVVFILGHMLVFLSLLILNFSQSNLIFFSLAWFFSGLGGGSIYCLKRIEKEDHNTSSDYLDSWEDVGHVVGIALSIFLFTLLAENYNPFIVSASIAIFTSLSMLFYFMTGKEKRNVGTT